MLVHALKFTAIHLSCTQCTNTSYRHYELARYPMIILIISLNRSRHVDSKYMHESPILCTSCPILSSVHSSQTVHRMLLTLPIFFCILRVDLAGYQISAHSDKCPRRQPPRIDECPQGAILIFIIRLPHSTHIQNTIHMCESELFVMCGQLQEMTISQHSPQLTIT